MYLHECDIPCLKRLFISFLVLFSFVSSGVQGNAKRVSSFRSKTPINNVLVKGNKIYVAAVNSLYLLNGTDLSILEQTASGPVLDSPECSPTLENCIGSRDSIEQTDNYNKILQFLPNEKLLLVCGSVRQGSCEWRHLDTLKLNSSSAFSTSVPVASNGADASTIASVFIDEHGEEKLYVAASHAIDSPYREAFPAVATRLIPSMLPLNSGAIDGEASVVIRAEFRPRFKVQYVSTFTDEHYVYWATVQSKDVKGTSLVNPMVSRLVRVCRGDDKYVSYSEIEIQCRDEENTNYNIVQDLKHIGTDLVGVFNDASGRKSAICVFNMSKIRLTFWYNIDRCWSGTDSIGLPHIGRDSKCINKSRFAITEDTCLFGVGGTIEASQMASAQFTDRVLTSVAGRTVHGHTLIIAGTKAGDIIQMEMLGEHNKRLEQYDDFVTGPDAIQKLEFIDNEHYYASNGNELLTYKISSCPEKADCDSCVAAKDPLCGFCLSEGKCMPQIECQSGLVRQCPRRLGSVTPTNVSMSSSEEVSVFVPVENLPSPEALLNKYECYYGAFKSMARWTSGGIHCSMPKEKPQLFGDLDSVVVPLAVRSSVSRYNIVEQNFTFFDCSKHTICSKCSQSKWPCGWCQNQHRCVSNSECSTPLSNANECPRIDVSQHSNLLVSDSTNASLAFSVLNMDAGSASGLSCVIGETSNTQKQTVPATLNSRGRVKCKPAQFKYAEEKSEANFTLELVQNRETIDKVQLTVYKCELMGTDCSQCLALDPKYQCTWCNGGCHFHEKCPSRAGKPELLCNEPVIQSFYPMSGPIEGGTRIEIFGRDLGSRIQDVKDRVMVGGSKCKVIDYEVSVKIVCIVEAGTSNGPVRVAIGNGRRTVESTENFRFQEPIIRSIYPNFGPLSGGTRLVIYGDNLNVGANVSIFLDNHPCELMDESPRLPNEIYCRTTESHRAYTVTALRLQIDDTVRVLATNFEYRPNPSIDSINPLVSIESGGRNLLIEGSNFDSILTAQMYLLSDVHPERATLASELSKCHILNSTQMMCKSPHVVKSNTGTSNRHSFNRYPIGFAMDGVKEVRNLGRQHQLTTVPDPQLAPFKGVKTLTLGQPLAIEGKHLELAATANEYNITIGVVPCPIIVLEPTQLVCRTPDELPPSTDDFGRELRDGRSLVVVRLGHIRAEIGPLEFAEAGTLQASAFLRTNLLRMVMLVIFAIGILAAIALLLFLLWRRRSNENERTYKRIKQQMEQLESNVRSECKKAFAELQSDMTDVIIEDVGVPFNERNEFTSRLLFREGIDSSILNGYGTAGIYSTRMPMAIVQFESLLFNRQFLFVMVRMVESNAGITASERSTLSSLLISTISRDMGYCTEVVFTLLAAHIQQLAQNKSSVALLFRRSDSLIEKLFQHWLSITLFPALLEPNGPGRQFFLLYKALKYQCEKGPIDACTGNARYSLSEQRLLRESVDCSPVVLMILPIAGFDQAPIPLRVLDCDTILQVKTKLLDLLYRNTPFSKRMTVDNFDLEWRCPRRGNILLLDDDQPQLKGMKKLHTVGYYGLQTNSVLTMQQRGQHSFTFRSGSSDTTCSAWSSAQLIDSNGLPISPLGSCYNVQYYHLTAPNHGNFSSLPSALLSLDKKGKKQHNLKRQNSQQHLFIEDCHWTKNIPEIFLTRMVMTKGTVQQYVDSFFDAVTYSSNDANDVPVVLKYVLDFLDMEAARNNITDPQIIHAWKTNAYVLRFWMQLFHNSDCLFDIQRQQCIDASMTVIGQTLIDAFSSVDVPLGKESPSSKLLFAKDIARYRPVASRMFARIRQHPPVDDEKFVEYIRSMSNMNGFSSHMATSELLNWSKANVLRLSEFLDQDPVALKLRLGERLQESVRCSIVPSEPEHVYATLN